MNQAPSTVVRGRVLAAHATLVSLKSVITLQLPIVFQQLKDAVAMCELVEWLEKEVNKYYRIL